jgi:Sulfotransferase family
MHSVSAGDRGADDMTMPNFLIIGAMKSGTTALYHYLRQHPQIYLDPTRKESQFFSFEGQMPDFCGPGDESIYRYFINNVREFEALFGDASGRPAVGEVGTIYLYMPRTAERIKHYIPAARLIAILRHPADRAYSNYLHRVRERLEPCAEFAEALRHEPIRRQQNWSPEWHYLQVGFYYGQLKRYYEIFDPDQIRVYLYDDFQSNPIRLLQDIFAFIGVDDTFVPNVTLRHNVAGVPRSRMLYRFLDKRNPLKSAMKPFIPREFRLASQEILRRLNQRRPPPLDPALRRELVQVYQEDILKLQDLIGRDLSHWLEEQPIPAR